MYKFFIPIAFVSFSNIVHNREKSVHSKVANSRMDKWVMVHSHNEILQRSENELWLFLSIWVKSKTQYGAKETNHRIQNSKTAKIRSSCCGSAETNWTGIHEDADLTPGLTQWVKDPVLLWAVVWGRRHSSDLALLWLWHKPTATAPIPPLAWEPPYAMGVAQEMAKRQKIKIKLERNKNIQ